MMRTAWLLLFFCLSCRLSLVGQPVTAERRLKVVFIEAFGNNVVQAQHAAYGIWSINYDTRLRKGREDGWGLRVGFGMKTTGEYSRYYQSFYAPIMLNYVKGQGHVCLETGIGTTLLMTDWFVSGNQTGQDIKQHLLTKIVFGNVGIRLQPVKFGGFCRISWTPALGVTGQIDYKRVGVSVGLGFR